MNDRGEYRTVFCSFGDDLDVHALSGDAVKLFVFLKLELPPTGIGIVYPSMYAEKMRLDTVGLEAVFQELERPKPDNDFGWIARQRNVVWIVNALKFDLNLVPANKKKHVPYVHRLVAELDPKLDIVRAFKSHYREWFPDAPKSNWKPADRVSHRVSDRVSDRVSGDRVSDRVSIPRSLAGALAGSLQDQNSEDLGKERGRAETAAPSLFDDPDIATFGRTFYGAAPRDRIRAVKRQLKATLNGGAKLRRGVVVLAGSLERLKAKCREVIAEGVKDPDKAIVVLLKKLADVGNAQDSPTERAAALEKADDQFTAVRLAHATAWLELNPELAATIDRDVDARFAEEQAKLAQPISKPFADLTRRFYRNAAVLKAWTDAGEPIPHTAAAGGTSP